MDKRAAENLVKFLSDPENYDRDIVEESVSRKKKHREEVKQRILGCLKKAEIAEVKRKERNSEEREETPAIQNSIQVGKRKQEEFDSKMIYFFSSSKGIVKGIAKACVNGYQVQFRDGEEINEDEKKRAEERDRKAMEILKQINVEESE